ncbi:MAG: 4-hydroxythreonine-4-phosphate dehydrogenase PdxA [Candidatus Atribacteria bacterium]|nr:4-hydroxythreonine-4-phosphate dehydrogenase PdxA [Candidatus Atribacteria bacterium]
MLKPTLALTMGDPAGVGPEIVVKTIASWDMEAVPLVVGDRGVLEKAQEVSGVTVKWQDAHFPLQGEGPFLLHLGNVDCSSFSFGKIAPEMGRASYEYIERAVILALERRVQGIVTAPISKEALHRAGIPFIGHTEILQSLSGVAQALTMFQVGRLRVFFLTRHLSLREAIERVKKDVLVSFVEKMVVYLRILGISTPRIAIAALNPHAGENGLLGKEEIEEIVPAIKELQKRNYQVSGPYPADSIFFFASQGKFDAVVSLYHDQGHIATKCLDFYRTVSVTLGLPFIRTSPDHGTAFDVAGQGVVRHESMYEASRIAAQYALSYALPLEDKAP